MPNIAETQAGLQQLAADGTYEVEVVDDTTVRVHRDYEGVLVGAVGEEKHRFTIEVTLDPGTGEYSLQQIENVKARGREMGTANYFASDTTEKFSGVSTSVNKSFSFGSGGSSSDTFRSTEVKNAIKAVVEAHGWTRHRGFWAKLFGR